MQEQQKDGKLHICMAGFRLGNTLSDNGTVSYTHLTLERTQYHAPAEAVQLDSGERADGILEVLPDGDVYKRQISVYGNLQYGQISILLRIRNRTGDGAVSYTHLLFI